MWARLEMAVGLGKPHTEWYRLVEAISEAAWAEGKARRKWEPWYKARVEAPVAEESRTGGYTVSEGVGFWGALKAGVLKGTEGNPWLVVRPGATPTQDGLEWVLCVCPTEEAARMVARAVNAEARPGG